VRTYRYVTTYRFRAPIDRVWAALRDFDRYDEYTGGYFRFRELDPGGGLHPGSAVSIRVRSQIPYTLSFLTTITRVEPPHLLELRSEGDLVGTGRWSLEQAGDVTTVRYRWEVATTRPWMNLLAPVLRPLFVWNHDLIMAALGRGLADALGSPLSIDHA